MTVQEAKAVLEEFEADHDPSFVSPDVGHPRWLQRSPHRVDQRHRLVSDKDD